jgi:hypothetical protein
VRPRPTYLAIALAFGTAISSTSCAEQVEVVVFNRSDASIAFLPGMVVGPCAEGRYTERQIEAAQDAYMTAFMNDDESWIPAGARQFERGLVGRRIGAPEPQIVIISGTAEPAVFDGTVPAGQIPDCGGAPVGIE